MQKKQIWSVGGGNKEHLQSKTPNNFVENWEDHTDLLKGRKRK